MTIDEAIEYELNGGVVPPTKYIQVYREQIVEWLEELKSLRSASELWEHNNNIAYAQGRKDAIDEFLDNIYDVSDFVRDPSLVSGGYSVATLENIEKIAEQMKKSK